MQTITPQRLKEVLDACAPMELVDLQSEDKYAHSHIPGAVNAPAELFDSCYARCLKDKDVAIVLYGEFDELGKGGRAGELLEKKGFTKVGRLEGGLMGWKDAGYQTEGGVES